VTPVPHHSPLSNPQSLRRLRHIQSSEKGRLALVKDLRVGPISMSLACVVCNIPADGVDMIFGLHVLARRNFGIDYERREVVFGPWDKQGESARFEPESTMVMVNAQMCGKTIRFLVDTGAATHCVFREGPVLWLLN
jgi:hypothetical protein